MKNHAPASRLMRVLRRLLYAVLVYMMMSASHAYAEGLLMVRSSLPFPEAMISLTSALKEKGYVVTRVQKVDVGLKRSGYTSDKYRVVFFGKTDEVRQIAENYPAMIPYLPLKIVIFSEGEETLLLTVDPESFNTMFNIDALSEHYRQWKKDMVSIFDEVREQ